MATILLTWELGGGLGHLTTLAALGHALHARGHRVFAAVRELTHAGRVFDPAAVCCLQAPFMQRLAPGLARPIISFAHILHNTGFADAAQLAALARAWRHLYDLIQPDVLVVNHSPTALLASRGLNVKRVLAGTGFEQPPSTGALPNLRPWVNADPRSLFDDERSVLDNANAALAGVGAPPLDALSQLYACADESQLFTLEALDPYAPRADARYYGVVATPDGAPPRWPRGDGARIFAYLKPFDGLGILLKTLGQLGAIAIIFAPGVDAKLRDAAASCRVRFADRPLAMSAVAAECDAAILNGTNAAVAQMLLAGKPMLNIPIVLEQRYNARGAQRLGAAVTASPGKPAEIIARVNDLLTQASLADAAKRFAAKAPAGISPFSEAVERIELLAVSR